MSGTRSCAPASGVHTQSITQCVAILWHGRPARRFLLFQMLSGVSGVSNQREIAGCMFRPWGTQRFHAARRSGQNQAAPGDRRYERARRSRRRDIATPRPLRRRDRSRQASPRPAAQTGFASSRPVCHPVRVDRSHAKFIPHSGSARDELEDYDDGCACLLARSAPLAVSGSGLRAQCWRLERQVEDAPPIPIATPCRRQPYDCLLPDSSCCAINATSSKDPEATDITRL
jgi:hypothetical protein